MALHPSVKKTATRQTIEFNAGGGKSNVYRVEFMVDQSGPFVEEFKQSEFTTEHVEERLNRVAAVVVAS